MPRKKKKLHPNHKVGLAQKKLLTEANVAAFKAIGFTHRRLNREVNVIAYEEAAGVEPRKAQSHKLRNYRVLGEICPKYNIPLPLITGRTKAKLLLFVEPERREQAQAFPVIPYTQVAVQPKKTSSPASELVSSEQAALFYQSYSWRKLRMEVLRACGFRCGCCGRTPQQHGITLHVDHIKPLRKFWELRLDPKNLQVLCEECNHGKGNWLVEDFRTPAQQEALQNVTPIKRVRLTRRV